MSEPGYDPNRSGSGTMIVVLVLVLLGGAAAGWYFWPRGEDPQVELTPPVPEPVPDPTEPVDPPKPVEAVVQELEVDKNLNEWLAVPGIVRRLAAATWRVSNGDSPSPVLGFLVLGSRFQVREDGETTYIDPSSYRRYDKIVDRIVSVDPNEAAQAYKRLRPNFEAAFREIAQPGERFHDVAKKAVKRVLGVKVPAGQIEVIGKGATFFYADESLESLAAADKHVLRLGPKNARRVQDWLRKAAGAAGLLR